MAEVTTASRNTDTTRHCKSFSSGGRGVFAQQVYYDESVPSVRLVSEQEHKQKNSKYV